MLQDVSVLLTKVSFFLVISCLYCSLCVLISALAHVLNRNSDWMRCAWFNHKLFHCRLHKAGIKDLQLKQLPKNVPYVLLSVVAGFCYVTSFFRAVFYVTITCCKAYFFSIITCSKVDKCNQTRTSSTTGNTGWISFLFLTTSQLPC